MTIIGWEKIKKSVCKLTLWFSGVAPEFASSAKKLDIFFMPRNYRHFGIQISANARKLRENNYIFQHWIINTSQSYYYYVLLLFIHLLWFVTVNGIMYNYFCISCRSTPQKLSLVVDSFYVHVTYLLHLYREKQQTFL